MMGRFPRMLLLASALYSAIWARTVRESLRITWEEGAPNGQRREFIHTNGQFPSPTLVWDEGDDVEVGVTSPTTQTYIHGADVRCLLGNCHQ